MNKRIQRCPYCAFIGHRRSKLQPNSKLEDKLKGFWGLRTSLFQSFCQQHVLFQLGHGQDVKGMSVSIMSLSHMSILHVSQLIESVALTYKSFQSLLIDPSEQLRSEAKPDGTTIGIQLVHSRNWNRRRKPRLE